MRNQLPQHITIVLCVICCCLFADITANAVVVSFTDNAVPAFGFNCMQLAACTIAASALIVLTMDTVWWKTGQMCRALAQVSIALLTTGIYLALLFPVMLPVIMIRNPKDPDYYAGSTSTMNIVYRSVAVFHWAALWRSALRMADPQLYWEEQ